MGIILLFQDTGAVEIEAGVLSATPDLGEPTASTGASVSEASLVSLAELCGVLQGADVIIHSPLFLASSGLICILRTGTAVAGGALDAETGVAFSRNILGVALPASPLEAIAGLEGYFLFGALEELGIKSNVCLGLECATRVTLEKEIKSSL